MTQNNSNTGEHTKGKWNNDLHDGNVYCGGVVVANCYSSLLMPKTVKANAKFVADSVNNYEQLQAENKELREALQNIVNDFMANNLGDKEIHKTTNVNGTDYPYWPPAGAIVSSQFIAKAREALNNTKNKNS